MFYPDIASTAKVMTDLALDIAAIGYSVNVVCQNRPYNNPDTIFPLQEKNGNVMINRFSVPKADKNTILGRIRLSFIVERKAKMAIKKVNPDLCIAVSNPPNMAFRLAKESKNLCIPFVYILHDLYPDVLIKTGKIAKNSIVAKKLRKMSSETFQLSDKIVVLGRDVKDYLIKNYGVSPDKINIITNWGPEEPVISKSNNSFRGKNGLENKFIVLYSGNIGETADFEVLLDAAQNLQEDDNIVFLIVGNGRKRDKVLEKSKKLKNVKLLDFLPEEDFRNLLSEADVFFVSLRKELYGISVPSKTYYYLSAGKPIIGLVPPGSEIALSIEEDDYGFVCGDYSPRSLASIIIQLKKNPDLWKRKSIQAKKVFDTKYNRRIVTANYIKLLKELVK